MHHLSTFTTDIITSRGKIVAAVVVAVAVAVAVGCSECGSNDGSG